MDGGRCLGGPDLRQGQFRLKPYTFILRQGGRWGQWQKPGRVRLWLDLISGGPFLNIDLGAKRYHKLLALAAKAVSRLP